MKILFYFITILFTFYSSTSFGDITKRYCELATREKDGWPIRFTIAWDNNHSELVGMEIKHLPGQIHQADLSKLIQVPTNRFDILYYAQVCNRKGDAYMIRLSTSDGPMEEPCCQSADESSYRKYQTMCYEKRRAHLSLIDKGISEAISSGTLETAFSEKTFILSNEQKKLLVKIAYQDIDQVSGKQVRNSFEVLLEQGPKPTATLHIKSKEVSEPSLEKSLHIEKAPILCKEDVIVPHDYGQIFKNW